MEVFVISMFESPCVIGPSFGEVFHLDADVRLDAIAHQLPLGIVVVIDGLSGESAELRVLGIDAIGAQQLAYLVGGLRGALHRIRQLLLLCRDVELHQRGVRVGLELAVGTHPNGVG